MKHWCSWTASDLILLSWQTVPKELCWSEVKLLCFQSKPSLNYCKAHVIMQKVSLFLSIYLYVLKTYMFWSTCIYVLKIRGFFFLYCVWINGFYSLLDSRHAYTSANLVQLLLPQHLLSAYCHWSVNGKNFSHDSCWSLVWMSWYLSQLWLLIGAVLFIFTCLCPGIPKIRKQTPLDLVMWSPECSRCAQFSGAVKRLSSAFCGIASQLRGRSVSAGHSISIEVKLEICIDSPTYNQVAYE